MLSIKKQTYVNYEVWIIDGDSNDGTKAFLKTLEKPFYFISERDSGIYDAMNKGIKVSNGEWLYFLGTDDCFFNENVLKEVQFFLNNKYFDMLFGSISYKVEKFQPFIYNKNKTDKKAQWNWKIWIYNTVHHQGTFYRETVFKTNEYDLSYRFLSDYAMNMKLYRKNTPYKVIDNTIASCLSSGLSKTGVWELYKEEIDLKVKASSIMRLPFFYVIAGSKFFIRQLKNGRK